MKSNLLIAICLVCAAGNAESKTQLMTPERYKELCDVEFLVKKAADKKVVEFYNKSRWAIIPAGMSATEVEAKYGVKTLSDLTYAGTQSAPETEVQTQDNESQVFTASSVIYKNKAGTEVHIHVQRSAPLIAKLVSTSSTYDDFFHEMANSQDAKKLDKIDSFQVVEVARDTNDLEKFCGLVATPGATHFNKTR